MKKQLLKLSIACGLAMACTTSFAQKRYVDDIFTDVLKTTNIEYDSNRSINILYGQVPGQLPIITAKLKCDIYTPASDAVTSRPVVIVLHTGSFLPAIVNKQPTGNKDDSTIVELCTRFAKKGYVAVAMNYRQGWNPLTPDELSAREQLLKATYRGIQDVRNCVRFLRTNASTYGIDTSKIIVGGQATGGYIALAVATVDTRAKIESNLKFQRDDQSPMVNMDTLGDWMGLGGVTLPAYPYTFNYSGDPSISGDVDMVFNYGGAMGDLNWLDANSLPIVSLHVVTDPFAPYNTGNVVVPNGPTVIPNASGAGDVIPKANLVGVNTKINAINFTDPISMKAMELSSNTKNLYPFYATAPADAAPWEWWDRAIIDTTRGGSFYGIRIPANGHYADSAAMVLNPTMSASKARAYIDTIVNFVAPRIAAQFDLAVFTGVSEVNAIANANVSVYPNPAQSYIGVNVVNNGVISSISLMDITGRTLIAEKALNTNSYKIENYNLNSGIYFMTISLKNGGVANKKISIE